MSNSSSVSAAATPLLQSIPGFDPAMSSAIKGVLVLPMLKPTAELWRLLAPLARAGGGLLDELRSFLHRGGVVLATPSPGIDVEYNASAGSWAPASSGNFSDLALWAAGVCRSLPGSCSLDIDLAALMEFGHSVPSFVINRISQQEVCNPFSTWGPSTNTTTSDVFQLNVTAVGLATSAELAQLVGIGACPFPGPWIKTSLSQDNSSTLSCPGTGIPLYTGAGPSDAGGGSASLVHLFPMGSGGSLIFLGMTIAKSSLDSTFPSSSQILTALLQLPDPSLMPPLSKLYSQ